MTEQQHPITPPPELQEEWLGLWPQDALLQAARWGWQQRHATDPLDDLHQASADVSGVVVLSPAAQAVFDAASNHWPGGSNHPSKRACIAAAVRAITDQAVPDDREVSVGFATEAVRLNNQSIRRRLFAIADELEGQGDG